MGIRVLQRAVLAVLLLSLAATAAANETGALPEPQPRHSGAGQLIAELLSQYHYSDQPINDAMSKTVYEAYFEALDPHRYYFLDSDVAHYSDYSTKLDDWLREGELHPAYKIFATYVQRVQERADYALSLLSKPLDFHKKEDLDLDRADADWPATKDALDRLWRERVKNDILTLKLAGDEWDEIRDTLTSRYKRMARNVHQYNAEDVFQVFMNAWAGSFDPHTSYLSPRTSENFDINMSLSLEGIGALLRTDGDYTEIVELIAGGPAAKSGELSPGDRIIGVGQGEKDIVDVVGWRLPDVVDLIRGPKASVVRLQILPSDKGSSAHPEVVQLTRSRIELEEQAAQSRIEKVQRGDRTYRIGVIDVPAFYVDFDAAQAGKTDYRSTTRDVRKLLAKLTDKGIDALLIDLRDNAGGSLREATKLTGLFIEDGPVVQVRRRTGDREVLRDDDGHTLVYKGPMGVLVNRYSASASEIFAAAIQDYGRGVIIGERTYGKGTVQTLVDLDRFGISDDHRAGRLKLTIAKFYRVTGASTQRMGVKPDIGLPSSTDDEDVGETAAPNALPWDQISSVSYHQAGNLQDILPVLQSRHHERMAHSAALKALGKEFDLIRKQQHDTDVSLNEADRRAHQKAQEKARLAAVNKRLAAYGRPPVDSLDDLDEDSLPDTLLNEAAEVMADMRAVESDTATASAAKTAETGAQ